MMVHFSGTVSAAQEEYKHCSSCVHTKLSSTLFLLPNPLSAKTATRLYFLLMRQHCSAFYEFVFNCRNHDIARNNVFPL
jgi:hypothetical protein